MCLIRLKSSSEVTPLCNQPCVYMQVLCRICMGDVYLSSTDITVTLKTSPMKATPWAVSKLLAILWDERKLVKSMTYRTITSWTLPIIWKLKKKTSSESWSSRCELCLFVQCFQMPWFSWLKSKYFCSYIGENIYTHKIGNAVHLKNVSVPSDSSLYS